MSRPARTVSAWWPCRATPTPTSRPTATRAPASSCRGGPRLTVATVESMTGLNIDHYLQLDFRRFIDGVDKVGGVEVCTARRLQDKATKLDLKPGKHRLKGGPALQYVRSRKVDQAADL